MQNQKLNLTRNASLRQTEQKQSNGLAFWGALGSVRLHCNVRIQMVQRAVRLLATLPSAFVHALDFFIATAGSLVLLSARDRHERVYLREWMWVLGTG